MFILFKNMLAMLGLFISMQQISFAMEREETIGKYLVFVRHGHTNWTYQDLYKGPSDLPLSEIGIEDAKLAITKINKLTFVKAFISPLNRTSQTFQIINEDLKIENNTIFYYGDLQERYYGDFRLDPNNPPDAEKSENFHERIGKITDLLKQEYDHALGSILIVSHQKVFEEFCLLFNLGKHHIEFGGVYLFSKTDDDRWVLIAQ